MNTVQQQCLLKYLNFYSGDVDGAWGPKSQAAAEAFQRIHNLTVDGVIGPVTEAQLKDAVKNDEFAPDLQEQETEENSGTEAGENQTAATGTFWDNIKYFRRAEFQCQCGGKYCNGFPVEPDEALAKTLDQIREHFGVPVTVSSGIRCTKHNAAVGGVANSQHLYGLAADILVPGQTPDQIAAYAETLLPNAGGIGKYSWGCHIDTRSAKARWDYR